MKTKPVQRKAVPKKAPTQNVIVPVQKYEFVYVSERAVSERMFKMGLCVLIFVIILYFVPSHLGTILAPFMMAVLVGAIILFSMPYPSLKGHGILFEEHVELNLNGKKYTISYQKITYTWLSIDRHMGLSCLIVSEGNPSISFYTCRNLSFFSKDKTYKYSTKPIRMFWKALEAKIKQKKAVNVKPKARRKT